MIPELTLNQIFAECDPSTLGCKSSTEAKKLETIIGQPRAVRAMRFGLDIRSRGFNIYAAGLPGTGRTTAITRFLSEYAANKPVPDDLVYVNNFHDPLQPNAIRLPAGKAIQFQKDIERLVTTALADLRLAFDSDEYTRHKDEITANYQRQKQEILNELNRQVQAEGFVLQATPMGLFTIPVKNGQPLSEDEFVNLPEEEKKEIGERQKRLKAFMENATRQAQQLERQLREHLEKLDLEVAEYAIRPHFTEMNEKYRSFDEAPDFIEHVRTNILENLQEYTGKSEAEETLPGLPRRTRPDPTRKYGVNVLVDNGELKGLPVIVENNPTYNNIMGRMEHEAVFGALVTDFTLIRPGALHRANGGFLVLPVDELLRNPFAWEGLKRALSNREITIEDIGDRVGFSTKTLRPEPLALDVKVILIGRPDLFQMLLLYDEQFDELFKVKADFDIEMDRTAEHIQEYISFVCALCQNESLPHLDQDALARVIEHASRLAEDQLKLSTRFGEMSDTIRESAYYAASEGAALTSAVHVERAVEERIYRSSLARDRLHEMIQRQVIQIHLVGEEVGMVNGLSIVSLGDTRFGMPSRITASLGLGRDGVIDIERQADLGGRLHTKGVLILSGYLVEMFSQDKPLTLSARLVFEQSYHEVDGDSASSAELYALLSALSGLPLRQGLAVTGSVNQKGEVQAIGGVNEKIEGFFEVCQAQGLTGNQGMLIPASNISNLMLKREVRDAVADGKFHIYAVSTVSEGITILTGMDAGERQDDGSFPENTVFGKVDVRLLELAQRYENFGKTLRESEEDDPEEPGTQTEDQPED
jgi:lon-related putative ATP-dependent protease